MLNQNSNSNQNLTHSFIQVMSTNQPSWGSIVYIDLNTPQYCVHECTLQFNLSGISNVSGGSQALTLPNLVPAFKFFTNISITNNNNILDSYDWMSNYLMNQLYTSYEDIQFVNSGAGPYNSALVRYNMSNTNTTYQVPLKSFFSQLKPEILNNNGNLRIAISMESLSNIINTGTLLGTPIVTINSISALFKVSKYSDELANAKLQQLLRAPILKTYNTISYQPAIIPINTSTISISLSNFVSLNIQFIYFVIRPSASLTRSNAFNLTPITNFNIISSTGESLTSGVITSAQSLYIFNRSLTLGCFTTDQNGYGNVYTCFHTSDAISKITQMGGVYGSKLYSGSESLVINMPITTAQMNLDIYASTTSVFKQNQNSSFVKLVV